MSADEYLLDNRATDAGGRFDALSAIFDPVDFDISMETMVCPDAHGPAQRLAFPLALPGSPRPLPAIDGWPGMIGKSGATGAVVHLGHHCWRSPAQQRRDEPPGGHVAPVEGRV